MQAQQSVSQAIVDYHRTRLKLLKDVGIIDMSQEKFWLKDQAIPGVPQLAPPPDGMNQGVLPPDHILGK